jgi:hypothetical protein
MPLQQNAATKPTTGKKYQTGSVAEPGTDASDLKIAKIANSSGMLIAEPMSPLTRGLRPQRSETRSTTAEVNPVAIAGKNPSM